MQMTLRTLHFFFDCVRVVLSGYFSNKKYQTHTNAYTYGSSLSIGAESIEEKKSLLFAHTNFGFSIAVHFAHWTYIFPPHGSNKLQCILSTYFKLD
ncbi:MAG: hypothetical protein HHAS10_09990 [Candidatus Altimarinota bacterium]